MKQFTLTRIRACALLACVTQASISHAQDAQRCLQAHEQSQVLHQRGELREARRQLESCVAAQCPQLVRDDCVSWLEQLERELSYVALRVIGATGRELRAVRVYIDDRPAELESEPGSAFVLQPGEYALRVEADEHLPYRAALSLRPGERRFLPIWLQPMAAGPSPPEAQARAGSAAANPSQRAHDSIRLAAPEALRWSLAGVALAATISFGYFAWHGSATRADLDACAPACEPGFARERWDGTRRDYLIADISLGLAVTSGLVALGLWLFDRDTGRPPRADLRVRIAF